MSAAYNYLEVTQPIGTFYLCSIPALKLLNMVEAVSRAENPNGVQREQSSKRKKEIADYCSDPDAVFPTPIVVSVYPNSGVSIDTHEKRIKIPDNIIIGDVIDGQHRLWGIKESSDATLFDLPVVFMFDLTVEEKAYVFSTINSNQTKVNPSLIYDLFDISTTRSPMKTAHLIARTMNSDKESPFYNRLKMLGRQEKNQENATLSQGTFAKSIVQLISIKPDEDARLLKKGISIRENSKLPFRHYFIQEKDAIIAKIILNCFNALKSVFEEEWMNPKENILWKTTGFRGIMRTLPYICSIGFKEADLSQNFFERNFYIFKKALERDNISLTKSSFGGGGEQVQRKFANLLINSITANLESPDIDSKKNIDEFLDSVNDVSKYEIYDIAKALSTGSAPFDTVSVNKDSEGNLTISHAYSGISYFIKKDALCFVLKHLEQKYMDGMDPDSWLGFREAIDKE